MTPPPFAPGLETLVWPHSIEVFIEAFWQKKPLHVPGAPDRVSGLAEVFFEFDLRRLLAAADLSRSLVQPPIETQRRLTADGCRLPRPADDADNFLLLHTLGNQLYLATSEVAGVREWIERVSDDLGRLWAAGRGDVYATRPGAGADLHFDQNDNFTVQLQGRKRWWYSTAPYYRHPLHNSGDSDGVPYDPEYRFSAERAGSWSLQEVELGPGDMLYMPRGFLHGTRAEEDSLSFNINLGAQPWCDVLLEGLRAALTADPAWREGARRDPAAAASRIARLRAFVEGLRVDDLLATAVECTSPNGATNSRWVRRNALSWWCETGGDEDCLTLDIRTPDQGSTVLEVSEVFRTILRAIPERGRTVPVDALFADWPKEDEAAGRAFVDSLVEAGLLGWVAAPARHG